MSQQNQSFKDVLFNLFNTLINHIYLLIILLFNFINMSLSPDAKKLIIHSQIQRKIEQSSPTKNDINFYIRKINRLENDFNTVHDELANARMRLRKAQDYQIKYDLVLKQNNHLLIENQQLSKQIQKLQLEIEKEKFKDQDNTIKNTDTLRQLKQYQNEINSWKKKYYQLQQKKSQDILREKNQNQPKNKRQYEKLKKDTTERQQRYEFQLRQMKKLLAQKQTVENVVGIKVDRIRKQKDQEINRLNLVIDKIRKESQESIQGKNQQLIKLQQKFEKMISYDIQNIKLNLDNQDQIFNLEISGLKQTIGIKNQQILRLVELLKKTNIDHQNSENALKLEIKLLKDRLYKSERQNQIELYNMKERLAKIHALDIANLEKKYQQIIDVQRKDKNQVQKLLKLKEQELLSVKREYQRKEKDLNQKVNDRELKIKQLIQKLQDTGKLNTNQLMSLHDSFHKIESEKQKMSRVYQQNIGFLDQQIKWLSSNLELKNLQLKQMQDQLADYKKNTNQQIKQLQNRWKLERKEREDQKDRDRTNRDKMEENFRNAERQMRIRQKNLQKEKEKEERQKTKLSFMIDEMTKDNTRLNNYIKQLDEALKKQLKKNQLSTLDQSNTRRQMMAELERQKNQLETIKRMEVDQITKKFEVEFDRLNGSNQKLQTQLLKKTLQAQTYQQELKKIDAQNKNIQKINREKLLEYQRKMATLNNEISLTQNLYQTFVESKSKSKKEH